MNVGIIGSGGREHAICHMLSKSKKVSKIFCFPGNAGTALIAHNVDLNPDNFPELEKHCIEREIKLLVVGPEKPLVDGIDLLFLVSISNAVLNDLANPLKQDSMIW